MPSEIEESRLARAAAEGDGQAFARLYDLYETRIYNFCLRLLGAKHDAEDATQEAFIKVLGRLPEIEGELNFGAYLFTAARNASYDLIGKRKKASPVEDMGEEATPMFRETAELGTDPVRASMLGAQRDSVQAASARLPERQREVLVLREVEEMSYGEIAEIMEMSSNSVAQLISRARLGLRNEMLAGAGAAIMPEAGECERALPLLAERQDGKLKAGEDEAWLDGHLAGCATCPMAVEAMAEAGISYRAWAPVIPGAYLFRDTLAKAADAVGADWSEVERPEGGGRDRVGEQAGSAGAAGSTTRRRGLLAGAAVGLSLLVALVVAYEVHDGSPPEMAAREVSGIEAGVRAESGKDGRDPKARARRAGRPDRSPAALIATEGVAPDAPSTPSGAGGDGRASQRAGNGGGSPETPSGPGNPGKIDPDIGPAKPPPVTPDPPVVPPTTPPPDPPPDPPDPPVPPTRPPPTTPVPG